MRFLILMVMALTVVAVGCERKQLSKKEVEQATQNEKVKVAIAQQERQVLSKPPEKTDNATTDNATTENATESTEPEDLEAPLVAAQVLEAALKSAKAENKAVLVHFTADW